MSKTLKIIGIAVGGLVALLIVAAIAISLLFDPNDYKDEITSQVKARTGRTLTIESDLGLSFFPWLGVETGKATLGNAPGFGDQPFATLERVSVHVRLTPLLQRRVEAGTVTLDGLRVNLIRDQEGRGNWEDLLASQSAAAPESASQGSSFSSVAIAGLQLRDASLSWRDDLSRADYLLDKISLHTDELAPDQPIDVELGLTIAKGLPGYTADLKLDGTVRADLDKSRYDIDGMKLDYLVQDAKQAQLASGSLTGKLSADVGQSVYAFDGVALQGKLPPLAAGAQPLDIDARWTNAKFEQSTQQLVVTGLDLKALDMDATIAKLEGTQMLDAPTIKGVLDVAQAPLPKLLSTLSIALPAGMDASALGTASLHGDFTVRPAAESFVFSGLKAGLLGMRIEGDARSEAGKLSGNLRVPQFATAQLFRVLGSTLPQDIDVKAVDKLALATAFELDTKKQTLALQGLEAELLGMRIAGDARSEPGKLSGNLRAPQFATAQLFHALGSTLPQDIDVKAVDKLALATAFELDTKKQTLALRGLKADLLGTTLTADVQATGLGGPARYTGSARVDKVEPGPFMAVFGKLVPEGLDAKELGQLALDTSFDLKSAQHLLQLDNLRMTVVGLKFAGNLTLSKFPETTEYNGELTVERFSPRAMLQRFGAEVPVTADPKVLTAAEGKAHLSTTSTLGRFENVDLTLDDSHITGSFAVNDFDNPAYDFALVIDAVDVDRYLPPPEPADKKAKESASGDVQIPTEALKTLKIGGKVKARTMKIGGIRVAQLDATLAARDGLARLDPVSASLYRGSFTGGFTADARGATPTMTIKGKATDLGVGAFLKDLSDGPPAVTGTGSFNLDLTGKGDSYKKNLASANGTVGFALRDGALKGFDLAYSLCTAYNALAKVPQPKGKSSDKTPFEAISGTATVKDGIASTNDLTGTTSFMKVTGKGTLNLPEQKLDYDMDATMTAVIKIGGCNELDSLVGQSLPLDIKGTITEPKVLPDFGELVKRRVQKKVEDELKDKLLDVLGNKKKPPDKKP